jgi:hypothetical protein
VLPSVENYSVIPYFIALVLHPDFVLQNKENIICVLVIPFLYMKLDIKEIFSQTSKKDCS